MLCPILLRLKTPFFYHSSSYNSLIIDECCRLLTDKKSLTNFHEFILKGSDMITINLRMPRIFPIVQKLGWALYSGYFCSSSNDRNNCLPGY
jgi:hypothetical protein